MPRSVSFVVEGEVPVRIVVTGNLDGTLSFALTGLGAGGIACLEAIWFDVTRAVPRGALRVYGDDGLCLDAVVAEGVDTLGRPVTVLRGADDGPGDRDLAILFGRQPGTDMRARSACFTLAHETAALTLDLVDRATFGLRFARPRDGLANAPAPALPEETPHTGGERAGARDCAALEVIEIEAQGHGSLAGDGGGALAVIDVHGDFAPAHVFEDALQPETDPWEQPYGSFHGEAARRGRGMLTTGHWSGLSPLN